MTATSSSSPTLTVAIMSTQWIIWFGLQKILESSASSRMVVHPHHWRTPDMFLHESPPDVFILDLETERDAISTIKQIRESAPMSKIVLLCGFDDNDHMREAFAYGVDGVILKIQPPEVILTVIEALYVLTESQAHTERDAVVGRSLNPPFTKTIESETKPPAWPNTLTVREREVLRLVEQGLSNKDIAYQLSISCSTVRHHMTSIFDKVGVPNRQKLLVHTHHYPLHIYLEPALKRPEDHSLRFIWQFPFQPSQPST